MSHDFGLAVSNEERRFLWELLASHWTNREMFAIYADWLDHAGQTGAGRVVRDVMSEMLDGGPKTAPEPSRSAAWHTLVGQVWAEQMTRLNAPQQRWVRHWIRPVVAIEATPHDPSALPLGASHFGGDPHLPEDFVWPESAYGPLRFLAQIDFGDMRQSAATAYFSLPPDGWLAVFACDEDGVQPGVVERAEDGSYREVPDLTHVQYVPAGTSLVRHPNPWKAEWASEEDEFHTLSLRFSDGLDLPVVGDVDPLGLSDEELDELREAGWSRRRGWKHKLMGWPTHGRTSNTSPGPDWLDLLTLSSDGDALWNWCDGQDLDVYVHQDGLKSRTFAPFYGYAA